MSAAIDDIDSTTARRARVESIESPDTSQIDWAGQYRYMYRFFLDATFRQLHRVDKAHYFTFTRNVEQRGKVDVPRNLR